eukprot:6398479-Alexandrium_andersonii.AAC.1
MHRPVPAQGRITSPLDALLWDASPAVQPLPNRLEGGAIEVHSMHSVNVRRGDATIEKGGGEGTKEE